MISDRLFSVSNKLKNYDVKVGEVELFNETILSVEVSYKNNTPVVFGKLIFNDIYDMNLIHVWRDVGVHISYIDVFDVQVSKNFTILSVTEQYDNMFKKVFVLELQDNFSYELENSYLSKGFNSDPTLALKEFITELEIGEIEGSSLEFTNVGSAYNFVVPKNISNLEFFLHEFYKHGYTFYQDKYNVCVKSLSDLSPETLPDNGLFMNETNNQLYKNKIIDIMSSFNNRISILPKTRSLGYDFNSKNMSSEIDNDMTQYFLNSDPFNIQNTHGYRDVRQQHLDFNQHNLMMKKSFLDQAEIEMIVNGYCNNDLNQVYELKLKGNVATTDTQSKGNLIMNGYYISNKVTDKIVGDSMVQKISLHRSDLTSLV